ncbi:MAG: hypothetical protein ACE5K0_01000 [Candidatus Methanofastidiosia archaeon]
MYRRIEYWEDLVDVTDKLYKRVFSLTERKLLDSNSIKNKILISKMLLRDSPEEIERRLRRAKKLYKTNYGLFSRIIDGDSVGNILQLADMALTDEFPPIQSLLRKKTAFDEK